MNIRLLLIPVLLFTLAFKPKPAPGPQMSFKETKHNFGFLRQGEIVKHAFVFTNTGNAPLIISKADVQCECTTVDFPKKPLAPNATDSVVVTFDTKSAIDRQERSVVITSNAVNSPVGITFKAVVLKPKNKK
ncbi:MAG: DUF1573 domain-containing protein [Bacteroidia bacterium]|jgi:hypothetical protein|nr:DUF1573 domain-containing protein [Bacteroidia bacterium]